MSQIDKPLELIPKTSNSFEESKILPKNSTNQSFRRNSVHDIEQIQREDFRKV